MLGQGSGPAAAEAVRVQKSMIIEVFEMGNAGGMDKNGLGEETFTAQTLAKALEGGARAEIWTGSWQETFALGRQLGESSRPGQVYALVGDLGVGKTVFTQGFASGLGIAGPVNSPTFTILQTYEDGRLPFYHFDVYRIQDVEEMDEIGYEDCFYGEGVCLVEWGNLIQEILPENSICVTIEKDLERGFDDRRILVGREPKGF